MLDSIIHLLESKGYKITSQRLEIIKILIEKAPVHPTLNDVYLAVKKKLSRMSFSTLYNNIKKLQSLGVLQLFDFLGEKRIEMNTNVHLNLIRNEKQEIIDINDQQLIEDILKRLNIKKEEHQVVLLNVILK